MRVIRVRLFVGVPGKFLPEVGRYPGVREGANERVPEGVKSFRVCGAPDTLPFDNSANNSSILHNAPELRGKAFANARGREVARGRSGQSS